METSYGFNSVLDKRLGNSGSKFMTNKTNSFFNPNNEISNMDLRDEIIKTKSQLNKRNQELHA